MRVVKDARRQMRVSLSFTFDLIAPEITQA
jgi:hypothetical protein